jgi:diguanylate cyclase
MDLDHFKAINDTYGHNQGDRVLAEAARMLRQSVRSGDHVCRWGGEEFLVVLPGNDAEHTTVVSMRISEQLRRLRFERAPDLRVTASIGTALRKPAEPVIDWLGRADQALYRAKQDGRDCIRFAEELPPA